MKEVELLILSLSLSLFFFIPQKLRQSPRSWIHVTYVVYCKVKTSNTRLQYKHKSVVYYQHLKKRQESHEVFVPFPQDRARSAHAARRGELCA